ncbi:MAG: hypothetical protein WCA77_03325 [Thermoplasmata archaeon]
MANSARAVLDESPRPSSGGSAQVSPIAVVWCRQVDNEAESPGYTTIPEEFPGHAETLDAIRIVGNLTVNVADTQDYWDPDPSQPLSYYPNLFLYPAFGGKYTCIGRMFLSTEDRPRLGMKTLVLDTQQLIASGEYGPTILKWHASMGGARPAGSRPPPVPDPRLFGVLGEGFLFHRGSTDPVLVIASDEWDAAMEVILEMVRVLPASLVALGAILAFPYFLPQPKTNLHELTEQLPLALALMRVPRREAVGERHAQRISAWEHTSLTLRDLTQDGWGGVRPKDPVPLVLQYVRDQTAVKLVPITQRVDLVEGGRRQEQLFDGDRQGGKDRRKEMWRVGTAMESAALLLSRSRGRHVPVNAETARRAQEYLHARLPSGEEAVPEPEDTENADVMTDESPETAHVPPWLQRTETTQVVRTDRVEVVPVSRTEDPSLLPAAARPPPPPPAPVNSNLPVPPPPPPPMASAAPIDVAALRADIERDLLRYIDQRWSQSGAPAATPTLTDQKLLEFERRMNERLAGAMDQAVLRATADRGREDAAQAGLEALKTSLEAKLAEIANIQNHTVAALGDQMAQRVDDASNRARLTTIQDIAAAETRLRDAFNQEVSAEVERRLTTMVDARLGDMHRRLQDALRPLAEDLDPKVQAAVDRRVADLSHHFDAKEEELGQRLSAQLDLHLREASERETSLKEGIAASLTPILDARVLDQDLKLRTSLREADQRLNQSLENRVRETQARLAQSVKELGEHMGSLVDAKLASQETKTVGMIDARGEEISETNRTALADLQVRVESHIAQKLQENFELERTKYVELMARLKSEVDGSANRVFDSPKFDSALRERLMPAFDGMRSEAQKQLEGRVAAAEGRLRADQSEGVRRLTEVEKELETRGKELFRAEAGIRADLDEMDRRIQTLTDRLVPIVQKTWLRIGEIEKTRFPNENATAKIDTLRRELARELRRMQQDMVERTTDVRDRMEATIANQGKVWLAVVRQMSHHATERTPGQPHSPSVRGRASDDQFAFDAVPPDEATFDNLGEFLDPVGGEGDRRSTDARRSSRRRHPDEPNES